MFPRLQYNVLEDHTSVLLFRRKQPPETTETRRASARSPLIELHTFQVSPKRVYQLAGIDANVWGTLPEIIYIWLRMDGRKCVPMAFFYSEDQTGGKLTRSPCLFQGAYYLMLC